MAQTGTDKGLSIKYARVIEALLTKGFDESMEELADRAGCARRTIYRYLKDPDFQRLYAERVDSYLLSHRGAIARSLVEATGTRGPAQVPALSLYFKLQGLIRERLEIEHSGTVNVNNNISVDSLPVWIKVSLVVATGGGGISAELEQRIMDELLPQFMTLEETYKAEPIPMKMIGGAGTSSEEEEEDYHLEDGGDNGTGKDRGNGHHASIPTFVRGTVRHPTKRPLGVQDL